MAGVVKNMMVRVGADLSGLSTGFKKAGSSIQSFSKMAASEIRSLAQEVQKMESAYATISDATERINLGTPISKQIAALEKDRGKLVLEAEKLGDTISYWSEIEPLGAQFKTDEAAVKLDSLDLKIRGLTDQIIELQNVADLGKELGLDDVSAKHLRDFQKEIQSAKQKLTQLKSSSNGATKGVEGLLKSIKRLGVVSLSLRFVRSIFGELGSIVRQYISENDALQAQVNALKSSLGQALAPAINIVTNALAKMMPYITAVSNAIGSLITSLFGPGWTTIADGANSATKAISGTGGAAKDLKRSLQGFDEITKLTESGGGGGGGASSAASSVGALSPGWSSSLVEKIKEEIAAGDWEGVGQVVAESINNCISKLSAADIFTGGKFTSLQNGAKEFFTGLFSGIDWDDIGQSIKESISGLFENFSWESVMKVMSFTASGANPILAGVLQAEWEGVIEYFKGYIDKNSDLHDIGGDIVVGVFEGMYDAILNAGKWIKSNLLDPIVEGFKKAFQIHSPAAHPEIRGIGKNIILGVFEGILEIAKSPLEWIKTNVFDPISQAMQSLFDGSAIAEFTVSVKNTASKWWQSVKDWWSKEVGAVKEFTTSVKNEAQSWWSNVKLWWKGQVGAVESFTTTVKNEAASWWTNVQEWWRQNVGEVKSFTTGVVNDSETWWSNVKNWWDGKKGTLLMDAFVRDGASDWWENVKTWWDGKKGKLLMDAFVRDDSKTWWENVKTWWTNAVGTLNLEIKLPKIEVEWGTIGGFSYPKNFKLVWGAQGMILDGAQLFGMAGNTLLGGGEAGREALLPLDRNTWWMDKIADRVVARMGNTSGGVQEITVNVPLDGKVLASTVVRVVNNQARATGHNPLSAWL